MARCNTCGTETRLLIPSLLSAAQVCLTCYEQEKVVAQEGDRAEREALRKQGEPVGISGSGKDGINFYR